MKHSKHKQSQTEPNKVALGLLLKSGKPKPFHTFHSYYSEVLLFSIANQDKQSKTT